MCAPQVIHITATIQSTCLYYQEISLTCDHVGGVGEDYFYCDYNQTP